MSSDQEDTACFRAQSLQRVVLSKSPGPENTEWSRGIEPETGIGHEAGN